MSWHVGEGVWRRSSWKTPILCSRWWLSGWVAEGDSFASNDYINAMGWCYTSGQWCRAPVCNEWWTLGYWGLFWKSQLYQDWRSQLNSAWNTVMHWLLFFLGFPDVLMLDFWERPWIIRCHACGTSIRREEQWPAFLALLSLPGSFEGTPGSGSICSKAGLYVVTEMWCHTSRKGLDGSELVVLFGLA
jgi:hypothetical protein